VLLPPLLLLEPPPLLLLPFPSPLLLPLSLSSLLGVRVGGEGPLEDSSVVAEVGVVVAAVATEGTLLLMVRSRTRRHIPVPSSCPARSPQVQGHCRWCGRRGMTTTA
jgi:hypothetical protein